MQACMEIFRLIWSVLLVILALSWCILIFKHLLETQWTWQSKKVLSNPWTVFIKRYNLTEMQCIRKRSSYLSILYILQYFGYLLSYRFMSKVKLRYWVKSLNAVSFIKITYKTIQEIVWSFRWSFYKQSSLGSYRHSSMIVQGIF